METTRLLLQSRSKAVSMGPVWGSYPKGCGVAVLERCHHDALSQICDYITKHLTATVPWGEGWNDSKKRGYALIEPPLADESAHSRLIRSNKRKRADNENLAASSWPWSSVESITKQGILFHHAGAENDVDPKCRLSAKTKHDITASQCFITLPLFNDPAWLEAVVAVISKANEIVHSSENAPYLKDYERECIHLSNLVAIQPNLHNGDPYLPLHLDDARYDGFGIVVVTVAIRGSGDIVIVDDGDPPEYTKNAAEATSSSLDLIATDTVDDSSRCWNFKLDPGQMYVLSGPSRNLCAHGVIANVDSEPDTDADVDRLLTNKSSERVSLNFRFGIHSAQQAMDDIDSHWLQ